MRKKVAATIFSTVLIIPSLSLVTALSIGISMSTAPTAQADSTSCSQLGSSLNCYGPGGSTSCSQLGSSLNCYGPGGSTSCSQLGSSTNCYGSGIGIIPVPRYSPPAYSYTPKPTYTPPAHTYAPSPTPNYTPPPSNSRGISKKICTASTGLTTNCLVFPNWEIAYCSTPGLGVLQEKVGTSWVKLWSIKGVRDKTYCSYKATPYYIDLAGSMTDTKGPVSLRVVYFDVGKTKYDADYFALTVR